MHSPRGGVAVVFVRLPRRREPRSARYRAICKFEAGPRPRRVCDAISPPVSRWSRARFTAVSLAVVGAGRCTFERLGATSPRVVTPTKLEIGRSTACSCVGRSAGRCFPRCGSVGCSTTASRYPKNGRSRKRLDGQIRIVLCRKMLSQSYCRLNRPSRRSG